MAENSRNRRITLPGGIEIAWAAAPDSERRSVAHRLLLGLAGPETTAPVATGHGAAEHGAAGRSVTRQCPVCGGASHGRPRVPGVPPVSIAYARPDPSAAEDYTIVVVALAPPGAAELGIDAEPATASRARAVREALGPRATLRDWTRLEAVAKARGTGLRGTLPGHGANAGSIPEGEAAAGLEVTHLELDPGEGLPSVLVAVALLLGR